MADLCASGTASSWAVEWPVEGRPNLFIVGAAKAATTAVHGFLAGQDGVFMSSNKEPHFFSSFQLDEIDRRFMTVVRDPVEYRALFTPSVGAAVRGESSTSYLSDEGAAERIHAFNPEARIVVVLRDPVDRAFSHYLYNRREGTERRSFESAVLGQLGGAEESWPRNYVRASRYGALLEPYAERFGASLTVLFFEDLRREPVAFGARLLAALGLDTGAVLEPTVENAFGRPRGAWAESVLRSKRGRLAARSVVPPAGRVVLRKLLISERGKPELDVALRKRLSAALEEDGAELTAILGYTPPWRHGRES